jgi:YHS domain-containing protein
MPGGTAPVPFEEVPTVFRMLRATAVDPVCGRSVSIARAGATVEYGRCVYHFCSEACGRAFTRDPRTYTDLGSCRDSEDEPKPAA